MVIHREFLHAVENTQLISDLYPPCTQGIVNVSTEYKTQFIFNLIPIGYHLKQTHVCVDDHFYVCHLLFVGLSCAV